MAERREVFDQIRRKEITKSQAAKLLGISRTRINQLMKKQDKRQAPPPPPPADPAGPRVVMPDPMPRPADPAPPDRPATPEAPPVGPIDLKGVLDPVAPAPGAVPVDAVPMGGVDPDDADAGRELLGWIRRGAAEFAAKWIYKAKPDDPRLEKLKEENKFLKVAMKRNSDKAAPLGYFTRGWVGILIGYGIEFIKVATTFPAPPAAKPAAPERPAAPKPDGDVPTAPPVTTVQQVVDEVEGPRRLTIEERLRIYNEKNQ